MGTKSKNSHHSLCTVRRPVSLETLRTAYGMILGDIRANRAKRRQASRTVEKSLMRGTRDSNYKSLRQLKQAKKGRA